MFDAIHFIHPPIHLLNLSNLNASYTTLLSLSTISRLSSHTFTTLSEVMRLKDYGIQTTAIKRRVFGHPLLQGGFVAQLVPRAIYTPRAGQV